MEDKDIVALYWARSEEAIRATAAKYGAYCRAIIRRLLGDGDAGRRDGISPGAVGAVKRRTDTERKRGVPPGRTCWSRPAGGTEPS